MEYRSGQKYSVSIILATKYALTSIFDLYVRLESNLTAQLSADYNTSIIIAIMLC